MATEFHQLNSTPRDRIRATTASIGAPAVTTHTRHFETGAKKLIFTDVSNRRPFRLPLLRLFPARPTLHASPALHARPVLNARPALHALPVLLVLHVILCTAGCTREENLPFEQQYYPILRVTADDSFKAFMIWEMASEYMTEQGSKVGVAVTVRGRSAADCDKRLKARFEEWTRLISKAEFDSLVQSSGLCEATIIYGVTRIPFSYREKPADGDWICRWDYTYPAP